MSGGSYKWGWLNVSGVRGSLEGVVQFMDEQDFSFLVLGETWLKPMDILRHPSIVFDLRYPSRDPSKGRGIHGVMVVRNPKLAELSDFEEVKRDRKHHSYIWFKFRGTVFGGFYLPPSMELTTCIECVLSAEDIMVALGDGEPVFLVGDLNMRLGCLTGDITANIRSNIRNTLQDLGLSWVRPCTGRIENRPPSGYAKFRKGDLKNVQLRTAVIREFKAGRKQAKDEVEAQLGPLTYPKYADSRAEVQKRVDAANDVLMKYINNSLAQGGISPKPARYANSKPFWDHGLTLVKNERSRLMKAAKGHPLGSPEAGKHTGD